MDELRSVFFQDAALMQDEFEDLIVFTHPAFQHPLWPSFKKAVLNEQKVVGKNGLLAITTYDLLPMQVSYLMLFPNMAHHCYS